MTSAGPAPAAGLRVLVVDDEPPALDELTHLLARQPTVAHISTASDAVSAIRCIEHAQYDAVFLDIHLPGLDGMDLARVLVRMADPPAVVFVTAYEEHAVEAFEVDAADYLLKPVREERLRDALRRAAAEVGGDDDAATTVAVERGDRTILLDRSVVTYAEACGDYVRLHTAADSYLVRGPISVLEAKWAGAGFLRVHRGFLVRLSAVTEIRSSSGNGCTVRLDGTELPVSRRHARELKERLVGGPRHPRAVHR